MTDACCIIVTQEATGLINVSAPMSYKPLCYEILRDAESMVAAATDHVFTAPASLNKTLLISMRMTGDVDINAPAPKKDWCLMAIKAARKIIEEFDSPQQKMRPSGYADCLPSPS